MATTHKQTTAGSLLEQAANAEMRIAGARRARGSGYEATAIGGRKIAAWSPKYEGVFAILERAIEAVLDPGTPDEVEQATDFVGRRAVITCEALRDTKVLPLRQQTVDAMNKAIAMNVARLTARNATLACEALVHRSYEEVEHLRTCVEAAMAQNLAPSRLLERIDEAVREADMGLARLAAALHRLKGRAETEPARIDHELAASEAAVREAEEHLRVIAHETTRTRLFGVERAVAQVVREVQVTVPKLTDERLSQMYLPAVRDGIPAVERALADSTERQEARIRAVREVRERLHAIRAEEIGRLHSRGRVQLVGAPPTEAARSAAVDQLVDALYRGLARELRDLLVWKAPQQRILEEVLTLVRERAEAQAPIPCIDDVLMRDADPAKVALELDHIVRDSDVPVALEPGADRQRLREWICRVIRVAPGARSAQAMIDHAGYRGDMFDWTGSPDCIEVITWQPGISLRDTRVFHGDEIAYRDERADPAAPPIETLADAILRTLVRRPAPAAPRTRRSVARIRAGSDREPQA